MSKLLLICAAYAGLPLCDRGDVVREVNALAGVRSTPEAIIPLSAAATPAAAS